MRLHNIPIELTYFDQDDIAINALGAGIIPVSVDANGDIFVMLGKERFIPHWKGSLKWSGFEGGRKGNESIEKTASREYFEESLGVIKILGLPQVNVNSLSNFLKEDNYVSKFTLSIVHNVNDAPRYHITYIVQVEHDTSVPESFDTKRQHLIELQNMISLCEREKMNLLKNTTYIIPGAMHKISDNIEERILGITRIVKLNNILYTTFITVKGIRFMTHSSEDDLKYLEEYETYLNRNKIVHNQALKCLRMGCENCMCFTFDSFGMLQNMSIIEDFVEKQFISWWKLEELREVLKNGGFVRTEFFRAYFLPILQVTVEELSILQLELKKKIIYAMK